MRRLFFQPFCSIKIHLDIFIIICYYIQYKICTRFSSAGAEGASMEQIKVEFSDSGKKKSSGSVVIPPEKAVLKIIIDLVITAVAGGIAYYFLLPPMNFRSYDFYIFWAVVLGAFIGSAVLTTGAFRKPEYVPYVRRVSIAPIAIALVLALVLGIGYLVSSPFFRAKSYSKILSLESSEFSNTVSAIDSLSDFDKVPLIDAKAAQALADKTLGDFASLGLESQFELLSQDSTQINYKGTPYRVYPLQYGDVFKWFTNSVLGSETEGIPGYVMVNLHTQEAKLVTADIDIKYSTAEHFSEYLERHLRFKYPTYLFGEMSFEIDETGRPYWVVEHIRKTVGLIGGDDVEGIILVDAKTGEDKYYTVDELRTNSEIAWIDQAFDADLLVQQYNYLGKYTNGFWNSIIGQKEVKQTSTGYSFLAIGDDVYLYTGVTSVTSDDSILGFFFINQRTKEAFFYNTTGATEAAAQKSAEGKVSDKGWNASFPILLNIDGEATYFMALKDNSNIVKSYAMVNVEQYNVVAIPATENDDLSGCIRAYVSGLASLTTPVSINFTYDSTNTTPSVPTTVENGKATGTITDIRSEVISGTTYYYIELDNSGVYYYVPASIGSGVVLLNKGDRVVVAFSGNEGTELVPAMNIAEEGATVSEPATEAETVTAE